MINIRLKFSSLLKWTSRRKGRSFIFTNVRGQNGKWNAKHNGLMSDTFPQHRNSTYYYYAVVCLTTGPKPLPKRFLHIVRSKASSFKWEYPLLFSRSSSSFLRLLPRLLVTSISPFIFPSITCFRRQFLRKIHNDHQNLWAPINATVKTLCYCWVVRGVVNKSAEVCRPDSLFSCQ